ncbi:DUF3263 domain-containing protein [Protaetiibacter mangrovi]|uniref:DUF3263 domain-containing protein n=1 Tax=Protaetiibacter mangrovi TaxID=2970926 RepID=A0ABT1ZDQ5_9MICO|nr:DUF3263 domain-containing protein [Protaetiibacter mangrovi]MCS0498811.1 DUF3263 domain-containing protein [Protaetiibacter mangrovi]TPW91413.1 DUF3263 domain-containing protein [Schumannella luteola]
MPADAGAARLPTEATQLGLDPLSLRVLAFEDAWSGRAGAKASAIRAEFDVAPARYYQLLSAILDSPAALRHDPLLVRRLQRMREARAAARASRTFRIDTQDPID